MLPPPDLLPRRATALVEEALSDTRVVLVQGARQVGKSTLAASLVRLERAEARTLDDPAMLAAAIADPVGFVESDHPLVIDEVQRAPGLLLAIKARVDSDPRPGQFLLTGSAQVLALRAVADAMPGRVETVHLWPLSQGELDGSPDGFVDAIFGACAGLRHVSRTTRAQYAERVAAGGYLACGSARGGGAPRSSTTTCARWWTRTCAGSPRSNGYRSCAACCRWSLPGGVGGGRVGVPGNGGAVPGGRAGGADGGLTADMPWNRRGPDAGRSASRQPSRRNAQAGSGWTGPVPAEPPARVAHPSAHRPRLAP